MDNARRADFDPRESPAREAAPADADPPASARTSAARLAKTDKPVNKTPAKGAGPAAADTPASNNPANPDAPAGAGARAMTAAAELVRHAEVHTVLYRLTDRLHRAQTRAEILDAAIDAMFEGLACDRASILLFADKGPMEFAAWRGLSDPYRAAVAGHSPWQRDDSNARPILIPDIDSSDLAPALKETIRREGIGALAFFPLVAAGEVIGKFMTYYDRPRPLNGDVCDFGNTIARQLAFALSRIAVSEARDRTEEALLRSIDAERARSLEVEALMESVPAAIWVTRDPGCTSITGNAAAYALFRQPPGTNLSFLAPEGERPGTYRLYRDGNEVAPHEGAVWRASHGELVRDCEMEVRYEDGSARHIIGNATPLRNRSGKTTGAVAVFVDITERKRLTDAQEHLASIVEHSDDAIVSKDTNGFILSWNRAAERLFGYRADEIIGKNITTIIPEHLLDEEPHILARIRSGEHTDHYETQRRRKDGRLVDVSLTVSPMRNQKGEIVAASKIARDISEKKKAEAQHNLLVAELNHRVKNTLATVISIARQTFSGPELREVRSAFSARVRGLAQSHARLAEANWTSVELQTLFEDEFAPYRQGGNVQLFGPKVALSPKAALTLGLAIHELATNAAKYGALSLDTGVVDVDWTIDPNNGALTIAWVEQGGPRVAPPTRTGFGRLLLERALVSDLGSRVALAFEPEGLRFTAVIPTPQYRAEIP